MSIFAETIKDRMIENKGYFFFTIFITAFVIRLIHLNSYTSYPAFDLPVGGPAGYVLIALKIIAGDLLGGEDIFFDNSPIYYYILAGLFKLFGVDFYIVRLVQIFIGSLNCVLIALLGLHFFGLAAAFISGMIAALYGPFIFYDAEIIVLSWVLFLSLVSIFILAKATSGRPTAFITAGLLMGAAIMGRPNLMLFPVLMLVYFVTNRSIAKTRLHRLRLYGIFFLGVMVIPSLFMIRNYTVSGEYIFLSPSGGHNFYFGHHKGAAPYFNEALKFRGAIALKFKEIAEAELKRPLSTREVSNFWFKKGIEFILKKPWEEAKLTSKKTLWFFNDQEVPTYFNYYFSSHYSIILKVWPFTFGLIFPFSILGFLYSWREKRTAMLLNLFFLASFFSVIIIFVIARLRVPAIPVMIIYSSVGIYGLFKRLKQRALKALILSILVLIPLFGLTFTPVAAFDHAQAHQYNLMGVALWQKGNIAEAEKAFLEALKISPNFEYAMLNLIKMHRLAGNQEKLNLYRRRYQTWAKSKADEDWTLDELKKYLGPYQ